MIRYLLDTNTLSQAVKHPQGIISRRIKRARTGKCSTSAIVAAELIYGGKKRASPRLSERIARILESVTILDFPAAAADCYGAIRTDLERRGEPIGSNDMLIAAHAIHTNLILVSDNTREFQRIPGLKLQNWLRD